ncbi:diguanylate cyclase [Iodobacter sp. HSC-16F04]|uniref:diguanylate cyclase n=1 Tax=Iodobacter violaceini TaxID=3044271 RepID=A0ABX0KTW8_9NEIS|nr:diguanylate cyclase [Iodobacter violacea]NHQ85912.1 diguanylate cyclase [Iodobacter violacea]
MSKPTARPKPIVLIVDDMPDSIAILSSCLEDEYQLLTASNGHTALKLAKEYLPDLILLDVIMPELDGYSVCAQLKSNPDTAKIPLIFVTALLSTADEERGFAAGAVDYVNKPISRAILRARVRAHIAQNKMHHELLAFTEELEQKEQDAEKSQRLLNAVLDAIPIRVFWKDPDSRYIGCNRHFANDNGVSSSEEIIGRTDFDLMPERANALQAFAQTVIRTGQSLLNQEGAITTHDGKLTHISLNHVPLLESDGSVIGIVGAYEDITQRKHTFDALQEAKLKLENKLEEIVSLQEKLLEAALRDPLTGLYNRRYLAETLDIMLAQATRNQMPLSAVMIDIDHFKTVNDTYGHPAGDEALKCLARFLSAQARTSDIVCRLGGEEFLILMMGASAENAQIKIDKYREDFSKITIRHQNSALKITFSAGIAVYPNHTESSKKLLEYADLALYASKHNGRNRVSIFS